MKKEIEVTIGCDLAAYAKKNVGEYELPLSSADESEIIEKCKALVDSGDLLFEEDWSTRQSHRIVWAGPSPTGAETCMEDVPLESVPHDAGLLLGTALKESQTFEDFTKIIISAAPFLNMSRADIYVKMLDLLRPVKQYSVLLMLPEWKAENYGEDTYYAHVSASSPEAAVAAAREEARIAHELEPDDNVLDYAVVLVTKGHNNMLDGGE